MKSSRLEEDDTTWLLHEYPGAPTMCVYKSHLLLGLLFLTSNSAFENLLKMLPASEIGTGSSISSDLTVPEEGSAKLHV